MDDRIKYALRLAQAAGENSDQLPLRMNYGVRHGSNDLKDIGFLGPLRQGEDKVTEYSSERDFQYPSVYEGITPEDLAAVMFHERISAPKYRGDDDMSERLNEAQKKIPFPEDVDDRAYAAAQRRVQEGRSPFYEPGRDPYPKWSPDQEWDEPAVRSYGGEIDAALRLARQMGGEAKDEMIERAEWNPFRGLKIKPPAEKLSSEPDIREYQLKRHAHEFEGAPEPVAPTRKVVVDAPLFGGKKELGELPYDYAGMANTALNAIYGFKTAPLYSNPYTAPVGRALDAYEFAKKVEEDPSAVSSYTALPKLLRGAGPLGLGAAGIGAAVSASDEDEEPVHRAFGGVTDAEILDALRLANKRLKGGKINTKIDRDPDWDMALSCGGLATDYGYDE